MPLLLAFLDNIILNTVVSSFSTKVDEAKCKKEIEYYCVKNHLKDYFIVAFEEKLDGKETVDMDIFEENLKQTADEILKRSYIYTEQNITAKVDPVWYNKEIEDNIKLRKQYNILHRNCSNQQEKENYWKLYLDQKKLVQEMVRKAITEYEFKLTEEIRRGGSKDMWSKINKLRGKNNQVKSCKIYGMDKKELEAGNIKVELLKHWSAMYQQHENSIKDAWNEEIRSLYEQSLEGVPDKRKNFNNFDPLDLNVHEWLRNIFVRIGEDNENLRNGGHELNMLDGIKKMDEVLFTRDDILKQLKKLKAGKQPGLDEIKAEIYIWIADNRKIVEWLCECFNSLLSNR